MQRIGIAIVLAAALAAGAADPPKGGGGTETVPAPTPLGVRLLVGGWGLPYIAVIGADGVEEWRIPADGRQIDVWLLEDDHILYTYNRGVREVKRDPAAKGGVTVLWDRPAKADSECDGCQPLPNKRVLLSESSKGHVDLIEIERMTMTEVRRVSITAPAFTGAHGNSRQVRKTERGTYQFALMGGNIGLEYDANGKELRRVKGIRYTFEPLPGGGSLGGGGDSKCVVEYDAEGKEVWRIGATDVPGFTIGFAAGVQRLPDGSTLVANWGGHGGAKGPCIGRISKDKQLIGALTLTPGNRVAGFQVLPAAP